MKKKRINPHDMLYLALCAALIFTLVLHISVQKDEVTAASAAILIRLDKSKGELEKQGTVMVDGRLPASVLFATERYAVLFCQGRIKDGIFLLGGAKSLCENQPISFYSTNAGGEGRIERTLFTKTVKKHS